MNRVLELALAVERAVDPAAANRQAMDELIADLSARASFLAIPPTGVSGAEADPFLSEAFEIMQALRRVERDCKDFGLHQQAERVSALRQHYAEAWLGESL